MTKISVYDFATWQRRHLANAETVPASRLIKAYATSLQAINERLAAISAQISTAKTNGETISPAWLFQQQRYGLFLRQVATEMNTLVVGAGAAITTAQQAAVDLALQTAPQMIASAKAANGDDVPVENFARFPSKAVSTLVGFLANGSPLNTLLQQHGDATAEQMKTALVAGVATGQSMETVGRQIQQALGSSLSQAMTISRTEIHRVHRETTRDVYRENSDVVRGWFWYANPGTACAACTALHGSFHTLQERLYGHPSCFVAGTVVSGPKAIGSTTRWFEGEIVEIDTIGGHHLAVTPNHPILTTHGWRAAGLIGEGDDLVCHIGREPSVDNPDDYQVPTTVEQVAESLGRAFGGATVAVPTAAEDFHGDGTDGEIAVVRADSRLQARLDATGAQPFGNQAFVRRDMRLRGLAPNGAAAQLIEADDATTRCVVCGGTIAPVLIGGASRNEQSVRFGLRTSFNTGLIESAGDNLSRDAMVASDCGFGLPASVARGDLISRNVAPTRVIGIRHVVFAGHVYNLHTHTGWYIANGIISHNCRCTMIPALYDEAEADFQTGPDWFDEQPDDVKEGIVGKAGLAEIDNGNLSLDDFATFHGSHEWGGMWRESTLTEARRSAEGKGRAIDYDVTPIHAPPPLETSASVTFYQPVQIPGLSGKTPTAIDLARRHADADKAAINNLAGVQDSLVVKKQDAKAIRDAAVSELSAMLDDSGVDTQRDAVRNETTDTKRAAQRLAATIIAAVLSDLQAAHAARVGSDTT